jgi:hypothetical protein
MSAVTIDGRRHTTNVPADYLRLVAEHPLRPIRSDTDYDKVAAMVEAEIVSEAFEMARDALVTLRRLARNCCAGFGGREKNLPVHAAKCHQ